MTSASFARPIPKLPARFPFRRNPCAALLLGLFLAPGLPAAPLSLDDAIRLALQKNQALKVSAFTPDIARANVLAEAGRFDPSLTFRRSYGEGETPVTTTPLTRSLVQTDEYSLSLGGYTPWGLTYSLTATAENQRGSFNRFTDNFVTFGGVSVTQPLLRGFGFGAGLAGLRLARADRGIAEWQHRQTVIDTVSRVVIAYTTLAQARENVRIARLSRDLTAQLVDQNEKRNRAGQISDADVIQARARLAARDEQVLLATRAAADLQNDLRQLLGESSFPPDGPELDLVPLPPPAPATIDAAADLRRALDLRPDFQAARLGVTKRRTSRTLAQNQLLPRVDFVGSYGYTGMDRDFGTARRQARDQDVRAYSAGVVVSVPLTFAEGRGRARAAALGLRQSEADLVRLEQEIAVEVAAAAGQIETTRQRVAATRAALDLARQALEAEQKKLQAGSGRTLDVLTSQEQLALVESSFARALADQHRALATYDRVTGTTLERRGLKVD
ncbi:MAG: TolC family protein [Verrucomicrobia bacterium]|nr:TolC family protein [Verrucomicrobiota bacterium]